MEEKKVIKIKLSTLFLFIAIIAIGVMGYFIFKLNDEKTKATEQVSELNNQVKSLENSVSSIQKTKENQSSDNQKTVENNNTEKYTYKDIAGYFSFNEKIPVDYGTYTADAEAHKYLYLYENGVYFYDSGLGSANNVECGNYIINNDNIILHRWFGETTYGDGKGLYLNEHISLLDGYKFTINSSDNISSELGFTNYPNVVLKRESNSELVKIKYEEKIKHDTLYNYSNTDMYTQLGQGQ